MYGLVCSNFQIISREIEIGMIWQIVGSLVVIITLFGYLFYTHTMRKVDKDMEDKFKDL